MSNTYTTVNSKISAPTSYTYSANTLLGNGISTTAGSNGTFTITNTSGYQISPTVVFKNEPASLHVEGKIVHNGKDLEERLSLIEKVLHIPERDVKLEKKHPKLKKMYDDYIKELAKYRMWESIKGEKE